MFSRISLPAITEGTNDDCSVSSCLMRLFGARGKTRSGYSFSLRHTAEGLQDVIEALNNERKLELTFPYLRSMEQALPDLKFRYAVIYKEGVPVLFAYFQLVTLNAGNFHFSKDKEFVRRLVHFMLSVKNFRVLFSGNAMRNETACYCFDAAAMSDVEALEIIAAAAEKTAFDECATAIILKDISGNSELGALINKLGYHTPWNDYTMTLDIDDEWGSLAGYFNALSRKYRARAAKITAAAGGLELRALIYDDLVRFEGEMNTLFSNVTDSQAFVLTEPAKEHFCILKKSYGEDFEVFGYFLDGVMIAFYSAFITEGAYELYYAGINYEPNAIHQLYFNILFSGLERAIVLNKNQLKLGRTSFDAKASLGAKAVELPYFIKTNGVPASVVKWFANFFGTIEESKWKLRNPLK